MPSRTTIQVIVAVAVCVASSAQAGPPPPPGGHIPLYQGGNNRAGYPPLNQTVSVPSGPVAPNAALAVSCNPNPFSARTEFRIAARPNERGRLRIYTPGGRLVRSITLEAREGGAARQVAWDGRDQRGRRLPTGMYLYRVELGARSAEGKIIRVN